MKRVAIYHNNTDRSDFALSQPETDAEKVVLRLREAGADYDFTIFEPTEGDFPEDPTVFDAVILTGSPAFRNAAVSRSSRARLGISEPLTTPSGPAPRRTSPS